MPRLQTLIDKRANAWEQYQEISDRDGEWSAEDRAAIDKAEADIRQLSEDIERLEARERIGTDLDPQRTTPAAGHGEGDGQRGEPNPGSDARTYGDAFREFLRHGMQQMSSEDRAALSGAFVDGSDLRAQGVAVDAAGGYLVPEDYRATMTETMASFGGMLDVINFIDTSTGAKLPWPTNDDTANKGAILTENTQVTEQDMTFGTTSLDAYMYTSKLVRVSYQLLQDSAFDLDTWLPRKLAERIARIVNEHFTIGDGTDKPLGLVPGGTVGVTAAAVDEITYDEVVDLEHSVDPAYRNERAAFMFSDAALAGLRKVKDGDGRPLWQPSLVAGQADNFNGRRYVVNQDMPEPAASAKSVAFGDFHAGYVGRRVTNTTVLRLTERYADFLQVGFLGFERVDGTPDDTGAYRLLQQAA